MNTKEMSPEESLQIISKHLHQTRKNLAGNSFYYLMWGWLSFLAALGHYILKEWQIGPYPFITWPILMMSGGIISAVYRPKTEQNQVASHFERAMSYLWISSAFVIVCSVMFAVLNHLSPNPLVHFIAGAATFISGGILQFKALKIGGAVLFLAGIASLFADESTQQLIFAAAILIGYIYPGYALKKAEN